MYNQRLRYFYDLEDRHQKTPILRLEMTWCRKKTPTLNLVMSWIVAILRLVSSNTESQHLHLDDMAKSQEMGSSNFKDNSLTVEATMYFMSNLSYC